MSRDIIWGASVRFWNLLPSLKKADMTSLQMSLHSATYANMNYPAYIWQLQGYCAGVSRRTIVTPMSIEHGIYGPAGYTITSV